MFYGLVFIAVISFFAMVVLSIHEKPWGFAAVFCGLAVFSAAGTALGDNVETSVVTVESRDHSMCMEVHLTVDEMERLGDELLLGTVWDHNFTTGPNCTDNYEASAYNEGSELFGVHPRTVYFREVTEADRAECELVSACTWSE